MYCNSYQAKNFFVNTLNNNIFSMDWKGGSILVLLKVAIKPHLISSSWMDTNVSKICRESLHTALTKYQAVSLFTNPHCIGVQRFTVYCNSSSFRHTIFGSPPCLPSLQKLYPKDFQLQNYIFMWCPVLMNRIDVSSSVSANFCCKSS